MARDLARGARTAAGLGGLDDHGAAQIIRALGGELAARTLARSLSLRWALLGARPWSRAFDAPLHDVLAARRRLAAAVVSALAHGRRAQRRTVEPLVAGYEAAVARLGAVVGPGKHPATLVRVFARSRRGKSTR